jgi:hypothetical protein
MKTIKGENIGPFFESGRLRGTPPDDDCREVLRCDGCQGVFGADFVQKHCGEWLCDECRRIAAMDLDEPDDE